MRFVISKACVHNACYSPITESLFEKRGSHHFVERRLTSLVLSYLNIFDLEKSREVCKLWNLYGKQLTTLSCFVFDRENRELQYQKVLGMLRSYLQESVIKNMVRKSELTERQFCIQKEVEKDNKSRLLSIGSYDVFGYIVKCFTE